MKKIKTKKELIRVQTMIEQDRLSVGKGFNELLLNDLSKLFSDYFDFNLAPEIEIVKEKGSYKVVVLLFPVRIKAFNVIKDK